MSLKIGADPEFFLKKNKKFISGHGLVPGTKDSPHKVKNGAIQVDGMALELNITPAKNEKEFIHNINSVLKTLRHMIPENIDFAFEPVARFDKKYFYKQPRCSLMLGCDPDFNAYTEAINMPPFTNKPIRTAAGHLHLGWGAKLKPTKAHIHTCSEITKQLDIVLGIPSLLLDNNGERRELYGKAGAFRPKPYGVEYRVLSNFWLKNEKLMEWAFIHAKIGYDLFLKGEKLFKTFGGVAINVINNNDVELAKKLTLGPLSKYIKMDIVYEV